MIKYQCIKKGVVTNEWTSDYAGADYYEDCFGKLERWVIPDGNGDYPEDISQAIETREVEDATTGVKRTEYKLPAEFTITQTDITPQTEFEKLKQEALAAQAKGAEIIAYVTAINLSKAITSAQVQALLTDPVLQEVQQLLWVGALKTAKAVIEQYNNPFYTAEEKASILALFP